jgi:flagellar hook-basal body complex protein FliE
MSISPIQPPGSIAMPDLSGITGPAGIERPRDNVDLGGSFRKALDEAHGAEHQATDAAERFAKGDPGMGIHEVMIASEKANIAIRYATTLKNKALEAYRELMNTQV